MKIDRNLRILVVDDFATMRHIMKNFLHELGFVYVTEADDGATALPLLKGRDFDLVITDWNMPVMEGIDLLREVRADPRLASLPVLMVTSEARRDQIVMAAEAGVNGYILKPFTAQTLGAKITRILECQHAAA